MNVLVRDVLSYMWLAVEFLTVFACFSHSPLSESVEISSAAPPLAAMDDALRPTLTTPTHTNVCFLLKISHC